ncbi:BadF/BadG/BcrA/BcrD ATPase family protein [Actinacidiphila acidipaludis]|uniref:ATPase n=1 Tax=Actinacidiphila acidipaludis TaxID=2873382 RepID=A0ABS7QJY0_9ACTN|nr:BadF/BadG/BcrA/BcrD ATPase family protein [Streptomyces acidipaludis]MBY8882089.1 ATPase [Streptomyces acidipaludis]
MSEIYSQPLVIGIDAGGTRSRACLALAEPAPEPGGGPATGSGAASGSGAAPVDPAAAVLSRGSGGPGNALSVGRADLTRHLTDAIAQAVPPAARGRVVAAFGGFAGAAEGLGSERGQGLALSCLADALTANGISGAAVGVGGDTEVALAAAPGAPVDGLVLIAGTGAIATRLAGRKRAAVIDGHGWLLGDEGSGYWLGGRTVRAALEALDGRGPWTALVAAVTAHYLGETALLPAGRLPDFEERWQLSEAVVTRAYGQPPPQLALLSPAAVAAADAGDAVALRLLDEAAALLTASVGALHPLAGEPLVLTGGLLGPGGPLLSRVSARLSGLGLRLYPTADGAPGAAALARTLL